jgi:hypothetical protein
MATTTAARKTKTRPVTRDHSRSRIAESNIPATMQAAAIDRFGGPEVLKLHTLPTPMPDAGEVLIAVDTAGVGVWDAEMRDGSLASSRMRSKTPRVASTLNTWRSPPR